ncbi:FAD-binding oxidoreductase, partial [Candidatus Poribacteria bacterium]|nr:FAD-binding oxidoreductase [Candidatus Poribacteria bacterium]
MPDKLLFDQVRRELRERLPESSLVDAASRAVYATDASLYQFPPIAAVTPRDAEEIAAVLAIARRFRVPVLPRGGGTSLAGQATNRAIIVDVSKHMNRLLEVNPAGRWARVQPGLVRDELNAAIAHHGLEFAPETSTSNRANIGGMIGNNSSGMRSIRYGRTLEHVLELKVMLSTGEVVDCGPRSDREIDREIGAGTPEGRLWAGLRRVLDGNRQLIA